MPCSRSGSFQKDILVFQVQLNIEPDTKKINIVDVLKVDPDVEDDDDDLSAGNVASDAGVKNFVESIEFCQLRKRFSYPNSVTDWTRIHTAHWAKWVNRTFKGVRLNEEDW